MPKIPAYNRKVALDLGEGPSGIRGTTIDLSGAIRGIGSAPRIQARGVDPMTLKTPIDQVGSIITPEAVNALTQSATQAALAYQESVDLLTVRKKLMSADEQAGNLFQNNHPDGSITGFSTITGQDAIEGADGQVESVKQVYKDVTSDLTPRQEAMFWARGGTSALGSHIDKVNGHVLSQHGVAESQSAVAMHYNTAQAASKGELTVTGIRDYQVGAMGLDKSWDTNSTKMVMTHLTAVRNKAGPEVAAKEAQRFMDAGVVLNGKAVKELVDGFLIENDQKLSRAADRLKDSEYINDTLISQRDIAHNGYINNRAVSLFNSGPDVARSIIKDSKTFYEGLPVNWEEKFDASKIESALTTAFNDYMSGDVDNYSRAVDWTRLVKANVEAGAYPDALEGHILTKSEELAGKILGRTAARLKREIEVENYGDERADQRTQEKYDELLAMAELETLDPTRKSPEFMFEFERFLQKNKVWAKANPDKVEFLMNPLSDIEQDELLSQQSQAANLKKYEANPALLDRLPLSTKRKDTLRKLVKDSREQGMMQEKSDAENELAKYFVTDFMSVSESGKRWQKMIKPEADRVYAASVNHLNRIAEGYLSDGMHPSVAYDKAMAEVVLDERFRDKMMAFNIAPLKAVKGTSQGTQFSDAAKAMDTYKIKGEYPGAPAGLNLRQWLLDMGKTPETKGMDPLRVMNHQFASVHRYFHNSIRVAQKRGDLDKMLEIAADQLRFSQQQSLVEDLVIESATSYNTYDRVRRFIDGDTMALEGGDVQRLEKTDTPEEGEPGYADQGEVLMNIIQALSGGAPLEREVARKGFYDRMIGDVKAGGVSVDKGMEFTGSPQYDREERAKKNRGGAAK